MIAEAFLACALAMPAKWNRFLNWRKVDPQILDIIPDNNARILFYGSRNKMLDVLRYKFPRTVWMNPCAYLEGSVAGIITQSPFLDLAFKVIIFVSSTPSESIDYAYEIDRTLEPGGFVLLFGSLNKSLTENLVFLGFNRTGHQLEGMAVWRKRSA